MTDLQIANMLADYHKECELAETLREKADVQLKHARLIREALRQPPVRGSLPLDLVKVIASKSYRQGCFHLDDMDAGMRQFEKWYESEIKELRSSGK